MAAQTWRGAAKTRPLTALFNPASIAVVGASDDLSSVGGRVFHNLTQGTFQGLVVPVNPHHRKIATLPCLAGLTELAAPVDLAVIATPAATVPGLITDCGKAGISTAIVLSAGFAGCGPQGDALQADLARSAHAAKVRVLGPNSLGILLPKVGVSASFLKTMPPAGKLAFVSQSGALIAAMADLATSADIGFSALVSLGNSADIGFPEVFAHLATDPGTDAVLVYVEGISAGPAFYSALRKVARAKPVIVLKGGRHEKAIAAAHTHTGSIATGPLVFDAVVRRAGAVQVAGFDQMLAAAELLATGMRLAGNRICVLSNGGGAGVLAADRAEELGLALPPLSRTTEVQLDRMLPAFWSRSNPVDILGDAPPDRFVAALRSCRKDKAFDAVVVLLTPQAMTQATAVAKSLIELNHAAADKPLVACWMGEQSVKEARRLLSASGIPNLPTPEATLTAVSVLERCQNNRVRARQARLFRRPRPVHDLPSALEVINKAIAARQGMLTSVQSRAVLACFGIPILPQHVATSAAAAGAAARAIAAPVAMKILSRDISHKSDVGGVVLNLPTADSAASAFAPLLAQVRQQRPDAVIEGVTIEPMAHLPDARELIVGFHRDPVFGPIIAVGAGGILAEFLPNHAVALPPVNPYWANDLLQQSGLAPILGAHRGKVACDLPALSDLICRVSDMSHDLKAVLAVDINPLLCSPTGVLAVDARMQLQTEPA